MPARSRDLFIVEDDQLLANALRVQVEMLGYSVVGVADTAEDAVVGILTAEPGIVLMDVNLGAGGSGLDAARSVRRLSNVPIVFYTSYCDTMFRRQVATLQNVFVLEKPVPEETLMEALSTASGSQFAYSKALAY